MNFREKTTMTTLELKRFELSDKILEIIDNADTMPRSDLQGVVEALVFNLIKEGE